jgi:hypothetical protein
MIWIQLVDMGFNPFGVTAMLDNEDIPIEDINHAVDLLMPGPNGYRHKFIPSERDENICVVCE